MRLDRRRTNQLALLAGSLMTAGALLIALPFVSQSFDKRAVAPSRFASVTSAAQPAAPAATAQPSSALDQPAATPPEQGHASATSTVATAGPGLNAYRGLGTWVDLYDSNAWKQPGAAVADMARHGVRTLFLETSNSGWPSAVNQPSTLSTFIQQAHSRGMRIVAWYLPSLTNASKDASRVAQAIAFRTPDGQGFDSFALDIESSAVRSVKARNAVVTSLSSGIRSLVGTSYPLGAIIPSPTGIAEKRGYWNAFPYSALARDYDVFLPMSYYTYHGNGGKAAYADTVSDVRILRAQHGCSAKPIHLIGGLVQGSSAAEAHAFVRAVVKTKCAGASLYDWVGTTKAQWHELGAIAP